MNKLLLIVFLNFASASSGSILFGEINNDNKTIDIFYDSTHDVLGVQMKISGIEISHFSSGAIEEYSFDIFNQGSTILSFGASDHIPAGSGLLTKIHYNSLSGNTCFEYAKLVTHNGNKICGECSDLDNQENYCDDPDFIPNYCNTSECILSYSRSILPGSNLISFWELPVDNSIGNVLESCGSIQGVIGEGVASSKIGNEEWVGSIDHIDCNSGYWILSEGECEINFQGEQCENYYELNEGSNLISYPFNSSLSISESLPGYVEEYFSSIIGEGVAATQITLYNWVGSLQNFRGGDGYWVNVNQPISFNFVAPDSVFINNLESKNNLNLKI